MDTIVVFTGIPYEQMRGGMALFIVVCLLFIACAIKYLIWVKVD